MHGWAGKMLRVDLNKRSSTIEEIDEEILHRYLGGRGLGAYLVYSEIPPDTDPLSPENILAFSQEGGLGDLEYRKHTSDYKTW